MQVHIHCFLGYMQICNQYNMSVTKGFVDPLSSPNKTFTGETERGENLGSMGFYFEIVKCQRTHWTCHYCFVCIFNIFCHMTVCLCVGVSVSMRCMRKGILSLGQWLKCKRGAQERGLVLIIKEKQCTDCLVDLMYFLCFFEFTGGYCVTLFSWLITKLIRFCGV